MSEVKVYKVKQGDIEKEFMLEFTMLSPSKSLKFLMFMGKVVGGSFGRAFGALEGDFKSMDDLSKIKDSDLNYSKLGEALFGIFERVDENEAIEKLNVLFGSVRHEGNVINCDYFMFDGRPDLLLKVAGKALGVNYKSFLQENSGVLSKISRTMEILNVGKNSQETQM